MLIVLIIVFNDEDNYISENINNCCIHDDDNGINDCTNNCINDDENVYAQLY